MRALTDVSFDCRAGDVHTLAIDMIWLGLVAKGCYRQHLGGLLRSDVTWAAARIFYLLFIVGLVVLVITPAVDAGWWLQAVGGGALFGLVTYATYDLTNLATPDGGLDLARLVDAGATVGVTTDDEPDGVHGHVAVVEQAIVTLPFGGLQEAATSR